jgi:hypothetical protein
MNELEQAVLLALSSLPLSLCVFHRDLHLF